MRFLTLFIFSFSFLSNCGGATAKLTTKENVRKLLENPPPKSQNKLKQGTYNGCVSKPAKDFFQRILVGGRYTGETCSITVRPNNKVSLSFFEGAVIPLVSADSIRTDILVGDLKDKDNNIIVVQHHEREVVEVTHTLYDKNNGTAFQLEYMKSIKSCVDITLGSQKDCSTE